MVREFICKEDIFCSDKHEEIIRCCECKNGTKDGDYINCHHFARWDYYDDEPGEWIVNPNDFCSWAIRKVD